MNDKHVTSQKQSDVNDWKKIITDMTSDIVKIETWRMEDGSNEATVQNKLTEINNKFTELVNKYNNLPNQKSINLFPFEWKSNDQKHRVFGYRTSADNEKQGKRKVSLICHLDTVPPGSDEWNPFTPRVETRIYNGYPTDFLIGRGSIDDKGPAVVALTSLIRSLIVPENTPDKDNVISAIQKRLDNLILEVIFDTSEETDMSTPHYFNNDQINNMPDFGVVFDAYWSVRAEKGIERPRFSISFNNSIPSTSGSDLKISALKSAAGSTNMIPVTAKANITGSPESLQNFYNNVVSWYSSCTFDDIDYHPAEIVVSKTTTNDNLISEVTIVSNVSGAQHGSAPEQNRANGANPVVSLTNFLAILIERGILGNNHYGEMCRFIRWAFGTKVFGENHPDLLQRFDTVFEEGNGTSYALTQLYNDKDNDGQDTFILALDIRYSLGHHETGWDGSEGKVEGNSVFDSVFRQLLKNYCLETGSNAIQFTTETNFGPDIRSLRDDNLFRINNAYRTVMGKNCPMHATGGATDAHGYLNLVTAGALFTTNFGPPVNYHGINEGAPLIDLQNSSEILISLLQQELNINTKTQTNHEAIHNNRCCCI